MIVRGLDTVLLLVGDLDRARRFYGGTLGLTQGPAPDGQTLLFELGAGPGLTLRLRDLDPGPPHPSPRVWLSVPDARAAAESLRADGVRLLAEPSPRGKGWLAEIADPWGNIVGFVDAVGS